MQLTIKSFKNILVGKDLERFSRMLILKDIGLQGVYRIRNTRITIIGCGATGSTAAEMFARLGVGFIRIIDRDVVDISNLPRTHLLDENDVAMVKSKAIACGEKIKAIDSTIAVEAIATRITPINIERYIRDVDIVIDGTDNLYTRFLINDASIKYNIPWLFIGIGGWYGNTMLINPSKGPCLRCIIRTPPREYEDRNICEVIGTINTVVDITVAIGISIALKYILGMQYDYDYLYIVDGKDLEIHRIKVQRNPHCIACQLKKFEFLDNKNMKRISRICGAKAVEIMPIDSLNIDIETMVNSIDLKVVGYNRNVAKFSIGEIYIIVFNDGRVLVEGEDDEVRAFEIFIKNIASKIGLEKFYSL